MELVGIAKYAIYRGMHAESCRAVRMQLLLVDEYAMRGDSLLPGASLERFQRDIDARHPQCDPDEPGC